MMPGYRGSSWRDEPAPGARLADERGDAWQTLGVAYLVGLVVLGAYLVRVLAR
jgi:hypothetical protein